MEIKRQSEDILDNPLKRQKLHELHSIIAKTSQDEIKLSNGNGINIRNVPQLNNAPRGFLPILQPPYHPNDFFTDLNYNVEKLNEKVSRISNILPPPIAPPNPDDEEGIMIPFIFPAPPVIKPDPLIKSKDEEEHDEDDEDENERPVDFGKMVNLAPLPFPPSNYMPYPINAQQASLTPYDFFTDLLDASQALPKQDMVVASAAGTLVDLKYQSIEEKFSINDNDDKNNELQHQKYYEHIRLDERFDKYNHQPLNDLGTLPNSFQIKPLLSNEFNKSPDYKLDKYFKDDEFEISDIHVPKLSNISTKINNRDFNNGSLKFKTDVIKSSLNNIDQFTRRERQEIYKYKKSQILSRLQDLKESKISLIENDIKDEQLKEIQQNLEMEKDIELIKLRVFNNYELLKLSSNFYHDTNKTYKKYNGQMVNKLMKLKNFLEFQKNSFDRYLNSDKLFNDLTDLNGKEFNKIITDSSRDYNKDLRSFYKKLVNDEDTEEDLEDLKINKITDDNDKKVDDLTDFLTISNMQEFNMVTGTINQFKKENKFNNMKHQIFKNKLYETSGSDSNSSGISVDNELKRRGRRNEIDEQSLHSESYLLAKIMKHFKGPESVNNEELGDDFESMGIQSSWN